jgi:hypothetical protein
MQTESAPDQTTQDTKPPESSATSPAVPKIEPLLLPKGALIAFRKMGGTPARMEEIVLYPDGRISYGGPDAGKEMYAHVPRKMNDAQIARLRKLLDHINFFRMQSAQGNPPPDAVSYEIAARAGNRVNSVTAAAGIVPDALNPLVEQLGDLLPKR